MLRTSGRWCGALVVAAMMMMAASCGGGGATSTPTLRPQGTNTAPSAGSATATPGTPATGSETPPSATTGTPAAAADPCTTMQSLDARPLVPSVSFGLEPDVRWQMCNGGAAAGSGEKYLFHSTDGGAHWTLISQTTLGMPTPQAGVGALPNGSGATALFFQNTDDGWLGLSSPGANFYRSQDGGVTWTEVPDAVPPAVPVRTITFSSPTDGTVTTADGTWTTSDGGATWTKAS